MRIKRLKLSGFKSFVEPTELRIERGLTGVVGPNGCGKSNLLEAIRWAMGESSPKSMRGGGMDDVIFAGTDLRPAREFAEVAILAQRDRDELTSDIGLAGDGEIEIVRRIERGAGSAWRVNGRDVRAKDVALLLADAATGAHSPALVSQGRIGSVIAAKPAERRQMLEEAAGIAGLHVRRKDAEQKLRAAEANVGRLDDLLGDMEARANALRRQARAAGRYRKLTEVIELAEARLVFSRWRGAALAAKASREEARAAETRVAEAAEAQRAAAAHQADAARALTERRSAAQSAREAAMAIGHALAAARNERVSLERRIGELAGQREALARDRTREDALAGDAAQALDRLAAEKKSLAERLASAEERRAAIDFRVAEGDAASRDIELALTRALAAQATLHADARVATATADAARQRLQHAEAEAVGIAAELDAIGGIDPLTVARDAAVAARKKAVAETENARAAIETSDQTRAQASEARDAAQSESATARAGLAALETEARALERALEGASADRLLSRIKAAPGYEAALAAALGEDLDAGLSPEAARRWAGAKPLPGDPVLPPGVARLADHIEAPPALARRLAQIGVVESDDGSVVLAVGQRLVTPDGRLRRWDGYVASGDGAAAAERLARANRLDALRTELPPARKTVERASAGAGSALAAVATARAANEEARAELGQAEARLRDAMRDEDAALAAIDRLTAQREDLAGRRDRILAELAEAQSCVARSTATVETLPDATDTDTSVAALRERGESARRTLVEARADAAAIAQAIDADSARLVASRSEAESWRARAGDAARRVQEMASRAEAARADDEALANAPAALEARILALTARGGEADAAAEQARDAERAGEERVAKMDRFAAATAEALAAAREDRAAAGARLENTESRRREMERIAGDRFVCAPETLPARRGFEAEAVEDPATESARLERHAADRERLGPVNLVAESELETLEADRATMLAERDELGQAINRLRGSIGGLNREGRVRLLAAFEDVDKHFRRLFATLFEGGAAHLALIDADDPLEAGLEIYAQPPGKKLAALTLLSGGEQALTAIALIFALFLTNPAPICVLDEVDAPLDDANIERFCDLLDRMTRETNTRYLIVTHNAVTMARMHRLFGVTMAERGVSRLVSVDLGGAETLLAAE